jgi:hypothetical protein
MRIRLFLAGIATLFLATGTAPASATWGSLWRCGKVEVHREYYPDMDPKTGADLSRTKELLFTVPSKSTCASETLTLKHGLMESAANT